MRGEVVAGWPSGAGEGLRVRAPLASLGAELRLPRPYADLVIVRRYYISCVERTEFGSARVSK